LAGFSSSPGLTVSFQQNFFRDLRNHMTVLRGGLRNAK
jgi:hypothetical protein